MVGLLFSLLFHEFSHALLARARGMKIGAITLFLFGGVAELGEEPPTPRIEFEVAAAGPLSSLLLAGMFSLLAMLAAALGLAEPWTGLVSYLSTINLVLAAFNLVPGYPLDGGRLLRAFLWHRSGDMLAATRTAARGGQIFGGVLVLLGVWSFLGAGSAAGIWWILIGSFVIMAARAGYRQLELKLAFSGHRVSEFMTRDPVSVPPGLDLRHFVDDHALHHHYSLFPVVAEGRLLGAVRTRDLRTVPVADWPKTTIADIMRIEAVAEAADAGEDAARALERMQASGRGQVLVTEGGRLAGIVTLADLVGRLAIRREIEGRG